MALLASLRAQAQRRGLLEAGENFDVALVFELVRDMTYRRAFSREPETTIAEWRGTCSGKHYLLKALLEELGLESILMACTHEFTAENSPWLPPRLLEVARESPVPDVHNFLRVQFEPSGDADGWMTVDATFPIEAGALGLPVNQRWIPGRDMQVACDPIELFHVPDDADPQRFKQELIEREFGEHAERRDAFIEALGEWLAQISAAEPA